MENKIRKVLEECYGKSQEGTNGRVWEDNAVEKLVELFKEETSKYEIPGFEGTMEALDNLSIKK